MKWTARSRVAWSVPAGRVVRMADSMHDWANRASRPPNNVPPIPQCHSVAAISAVTCPSPASVGLHPEEQ